MGRTKELIQEMVECLGVLGDVLARGGGKEEWRRVQGQLAELWECRRVFENLHEAVIEEVMEGRFDQRIRWN